MIQDFIILPIMKRKGSKSYNPAKDLTVTQTTQGVSNTTAEVQSVAGFSSADLSSLGGKTLFFHDGTNSLSVDISSIPDDLALWLRLLLQLRVIVIWVLLFLLVLMH